MSGTVAIVSTLVGLAAIFVSLHDVFHTLFHPAGRGALSDRIGRVIWSCFRACVKGPHGFLTLAGPWIFTAIIVGWVALIVFGFALIYWPHVSTYVVALGMDPAHHRAFADAFNISLGSLITIGGDFNARSKILRFLMGIEGVFGFGLLTASVSWLLSIYPVLEQRRAVAHKASLLHHAEHETGVRLLELPDAKFMLAEMLAEMVTLRNSLEQFPIVYYFQSGDDESALPGSMGVFRGIARKATQMPDPGMKLLGTMLGGAVEDYLRTVAEIFLHMPADDVDEVLHAHARDHLQQVVPYE